MEYFGREIDDRERAKDVELNPHLSIWHTYSFDHVYDMDSTQEQVYETTADRPAPEKHTLWRASSTAVVTRIEE